MMEKIIEALRPVKEATVMLQHRDASIQGLSLPGVVGMLQGKSTPQEISKKLKVHLATVCACATRYETVDSLKAALLKAWNDITPRMLAAIVENFRKRVDLCISEEGGHFEFKK
uniref:Transcriptional regulator n=1 Tax=Steinernema glaseri TaxID=37863 RepID=A0A1I7YL76_9BILA